jgi:hypothetical protein
MKHLRILILLSLLFAQSAWTNALQTLPPYHWANPVIDQLRLRGYFSDLFLLNKPYTRSEVAVALERLLQEIEQGKHQPNSADRWRIFQLTREFHELIKPAVAHNFQAGVSLIENLNVDHAEARPYGIWRTKGGFAPSPKVYLFNSTTYNQYLKDDPHYLGKRWRGFTLFTEQAFVRIQHQKWQFVLGRDFMKWGPGKDANLLISDYTRPLDQLSGRLEHHFFRCNFVLAKLDPMGINVDSLVERFHSVSANRYLIAHRLDLKLRKNLQIGFSEAVLYGGPETSFDFNYLNPLLLFYGEVVNTTSVQGNILGTIDFDWFPFHGTEIYGEFLLDDIQVELTGSGDLEPNELGLLVGVQQAIGRLTLGLEYTAITNRTYNAKLNWEKFLHRNQPIGHFLGNDFDRLKFTADYWLSQSAQLYLNHEYRRQGEGSIYREFDEPWMAYSVAEGYDEPFPTGTIQHTNLVKLGGRFYFKPQIHLTTEFCYSDIQQFQNLLAEKEQKWSFKFGLWLDWDWRLVL